MSLSTLLTPDRLKVLSGYAYTRGLKYWQDGRVLSCKLEDETLDGVVVGGLTYQVRISAERNNLVGSCTCPVADVLCKHAVALGLAYLSKGAAVLAPAADRWKTRKALEQWADEHHVRHALAISAEVLLSAIPKDDRYHGIRYTLTRFSLREVVTREGAAQYLGPEAIANEIIKAAHEALDQAAAVVRKGISEETALLRATPDPALAPLWRRLVEVRRELRNHAFPRSREWRASGKWWFDPRGPTVFWEEPERFVRASPDWGTVEIETRLETSGTGDLQIECTCNDGGETSCTHALALIDATLCVLLDPAREFEARTVATELMRPGWSRALEELARFEVKAAKAPAAIEVSWEIDQQFGAHMMSALVRKQLKRGGMSAGSRMSASRLLDDYGEVLGEQDRRVCELATTWAAGFRGAGSSRSAGSYPWRAFLALVGHPRLLFEDDPIKLERVQLGFTAHAVGDTIQLEPSIDDARMDPRDLAQRLADSRPGEPLVAIEPAAGRCLLIEVSDEARQLWAVLQKHGEAFPPEAHAPLLERLAKLETRMPIVVPHALKGKELADQTVTVVRLRLLPDVTLELELLVRPGDGAPLFQPGSGPRDIMLARAGERGYVRRNLGSEEALARGMLAKLPLEGAEEGPPFCFRIDDTNAALALVAAIQMPIAGLEADWIDQKPSVAPSGGVDALRVKVERKHDWFGIEGDLKIEQGRLELAVLLDAARRQQRFVRVDANRWVELSEALRQRLVAIADQTYESRNQLELSPGAVPAIDALAAAGARVVTAPAWNLLSERLAASLTLKPKPPAALTAKLRDYQVEGHAWLSRIAAWGAGACLADDMGLGKTVQAIAVLVDRAKLGPALVLAPTSVAFNWAAELERFAPSLRPVIYAEQADRAKCLAQLKKKDVLIVSYGLLVRDVELLASRSFATLVVDEAQALKNSSTHRAKAARMLDAEFRIAMSGTPFENHLGELWSLFAIIFPGLLGSWEQFRQRYALPIERDKNPEARAALSRVLRPFLLRRTKQEVARELPSRTEIHVPIALSKEERALYEDARLAAIAELSKQGKGVRNEQQRFQVLAALTRLRLLASHPKLYDARSSVASSKMRRLVELVEELRSEGHRALVFSQFTSHLALVREELDKAGFSSLYLDGSTPAAQRARLVQSFQDGQGEVFLISLKAGGTGINLTAADYVIHLDPWWNPAVEDQATDRAHRIGQTKPVTVFRMITHGTIEEQILAMHGDKRALVAGILEGTDVAARLTTGDLLALLQAGDKRSALGDEDEPSAQLQ
ncbi:MAG: SNF2-related Helicase-like protein [Myxococcales bacterium]|nr:SNF2-related Helicase-like protein [Myxococcales bacterium]